MVLLGCFRLAIYLEKSNLKRQIIVLYSTKKIDIMQPYTHSHARHDSTAIFKYMGSHIMREKNKQLVKIYWRVGIERSSIRKAKNIINMKYKA